MPDLAVLYRLNNLISHAKHGSMCKSGRDCAATVDTGKCLVLRISTKLQRFFNDRGKILILPNMDHLWIRYHRCCEYTVRIVFLRRHKTVGCKQHRSGNIQKFLLLVLPCRTEVSLQMGVFFQLWIAMCRKHFTVSIDIDPLALGLL